jgi:hypothetical protein
MRGWREMMRSVGWAKARPRPRYSTDDDVPRRAHRTVVRPMVGTARCACKLPGRPSGAFAHPTVLALLLAAAGYAHAADELSVDVVNGSEPTLCAEKDNVYLKLMSPDVRRFAIEAVHPAYMGTIVADRYAPDFRHCDMSGDPAYKSEPRRVTIHETNEWQLVGLTFPSYWRPNTVPVRVGDRVENGLHLLQLWTRFQECAEEVLVLYPADGYWRARPLPPAHLRWSAYGSSFLVGPVETAGRPLVDIRDIAFDPATRTFRLNLVRGAAVDVRDRGQCRRRPGRLAQQGIAGVAPGAGHDVRPHRCGRAVGRPHGALAPQHERARHGVPRFPHRAVTLTVILKERPR